MGGTPPHSMGISKGLVGPLGWGRSRVHFWDNLVSKFFRQFMGNCRILWVFRIKVLPAQKWPKPQRRGFGHFWSMVHILNFFLYISKIVTGNPPTFFMGFPPWINFCKCFLQLWQHCLLGGGGAQSPLQLAVNEFLRGCDFSFRGMYQGSTSFKGFAI